jgi:hypothetical protein
MAMANSSYDVQRTRWAPIEQLAQAHGITLPSQDMLPPSYTMRMWLMRQLATAAGRHKEVWQRIRQDPTRLQHNRELNRARVQRWRQRHKPKDRAQRVLSDA